MELYVFAKKEGEETSLKTIDCRNGKILNNIKNNFYF